MNRSAVFVFATGLGIAWLLLALSMTPPPQVRTRLIHIAGEIDEARARRLSAALSNIDGVTEAVVMAGENSAYLKVRMGEWDEAGANRLLQA